MFDRLREKNIGFSQVPQSEDCETLISDSKITESFQAPSRSLLSRCYTPMLILLSLAFGILLGAGLSSRWLVNPTSFCINRISQYSPVLKDVDLSYDMVTFNGSLLKENIFRQPAGPDVDAAWRSLGVDYRSAIVPANLAEKSGLLPSQVQVNEKYGGGFPANVEGLHHLHCLNLLRQALHYNFDYYHARGEGAFKNSDDILRFHVTHCLDILRQQLMCTVDVAVLGQVWWDRTQPRAYPDFNTKHKCRNFDAVRQWAKEHQAPDEVPPDFLKSPQSVNDVYETIP